MISKQQKVFSYNEVFEASVKYFNGDELAAKVFVDKYALQNSSGEYLELTPRDMHKRLAKELARIENKYPNPIKEEEIFNLLDKFKYVVPQGSPMSAIGNPYQIQSLSNCFVIQGVHSDKLDSYGGIMLADQELAQVFKRRGGCGLDISGIRPKGTPTSNAAKTTDGIGVFMERFSSTCREVATHGRRGAEMITISVNHPEIETFIKIKRDLKKVTGANISIKITDEFMQAVKNDEEFVLRWPVDQKIENAKITKTVKAKEIWNEIIKSSWLSAEPGVLFIDTIHKTTPSDIYKEYGFNTISTNPCFRGDTLIATADGRNAVSIKKLAEEGKDVPVYSLDNETGQVSIKMGRNPRITGYNKKLIRVYLDDNSYLDVTPDHKFILLDGKVKEAKELTNGDSLPRFLKELTPVKKGGKNYYQVHCNTLDMSRDKVFEHRLIAKFIYNEEWNKIYNNEQKNGFINGGLVIHHKDYNSLNNSPCNLQIMTFKAHNQYHAEHDNAGEKNGKYLGVTNEQLKEHFVKLTKQFGHRISKRQWAKYAKQNKLPSQFSNFRKNELGDVTSLAIKVATELGYEYSEEDPRVLNTYKNAIEQKYEATIKNGIVFVKKTCEECNKSFEVDFLHREQSFCSQPCGARYNAKSDEFKLKCSLAMEKILSEPHSQKRVLQAKIYSDLKFKLEREPLRKEWEEECKKQNIPCRVGNKIKHSYKNYKEVKEAGENYNHKVVKIEYIDGLHTVYNITVDDNHTVAIVTNFDKDNNGQGEQSGIFVKQCGEIVLSAYDACRLTTLNLSSYVSKPFTKQSLFDFNLFKQHAIIAQRLMDDIIDLELEQLDKIIDKVKSDPEAEEIKAVELNLWKKIRHMNVSGRRTGLGITALGDCLAMLNIKYGSEESIKMTREIYKMLAIGSHTSSCIMAKERGSFPVFNYDLEKDHPYLNNIFDSCESDIKSIWKKYGRRNIALTTTAPTGSVSTLTQTTSGIEPAYLLSYVRRKKINPSDKSAKVDFIDAIGDKWQEFTVYHHGVKKWMDLTGENDIKKSPYWEATSNDINWVASVDLQAAAQEFIDHSISKTCNIPSTATEDLISQVYTRAWESGCKGFTVYRDGCRTGVLVSEETYKKQMIKDPNARPESIEYLPAPKRPDSLPCEIKKVKVQGEQWTIFVGLLNGKPYELFGGLSRYIDIPNKYKTGKITKSAQSVYNLVVGEGDDEMTIKDIANVFENANYGSLTRMISLSLRHGTPIQFVVEQLQKDKYSDMTSFSKVVARVLKSYIEEGTKVTGEKKCEGCGRSDSLKYQEGCLSCSCGWSKC